MPSPSVSCPCFPGRLTLRRNAAGLLWRRVLAALRTWAVGLLTWETQADGSLVRGEASRRGAGSWRRPACRGERVGSPRSAGPWGRQILLFPRPECSWVTDQLRPRRSANQDSAANTGAASPSSSAVPVTALSRKPLPTRATLE